MATGTDRSCERASTYPARSRLRPPWQWLTWIRAEVGGKQGGQFAEAPPAEEDFAVDKETP